MTNLEIAQKATLRPIEEIARSGGLSAPDYEPLGRYKAKLSYQAMRRLSSAPVKGKLVLVTAINPTHAGEGKTTLSIGLAEGLNRIGKKAVPALREPALGPVFGVKGGGCGGGYSQILPMEDINLFFNGDFPAVTSAHNLLAAMLDASIHNGNPHAIDLTNVWWPRAVDMIDRALREVVVGLGQGNGPVRSDGFVITPASEIMATLCLSKNLEDLRDRIAGIIVGLDSDKRPITAGGIQAAGAVTALLKDAIRPNLVQTLEGGAAIVHGGPFGNMAHGCSSLLGTQCGLGMADYVVTEGGFGSDLGGEKFMNIVCPRLGDHPDAVVIVATVRALKQHGYGDLKDGCANLGQHIRHLSFYGPPVIVTINRFTEDTPDELSLVQGYCAEHDVSAIVTNPWSAGGAGCKELAEAVSLAASNQSGFRNLYERSDSLYTKLEKIAEVAYGGGKITLSPIAEKRLAWATANGYADLPVCVAKTESSLTDDPRELGAPKNFTLHVRDLKISAGAGFLVAVCGDMMLMPGLGKHPAAFNIDVDEAGTIQGIK